MTSFLQKCKFSGANAPSKVQTSRDRQLFCAERTAYAIRSRIEIDFVLGAPNHRESAKSPFSASQGRFCKPWVRFWMRLGIRCPLDRTHDFIFSALHNLRRSGGNANSGRSHPCPLDPRNAAPIGPQDHLAEPVEIAAKRGQNGPSPLGLNKHQLSSTIS